MRFGNSWIENNECHVDYKAIEPNQISVELCNFMLINNKEVSNFRRMIRIR